MNIWSIRKSTWDGSILTPSYETGMLYPAKGTIFAPSFLWICDREVSFMVYIFGKFIIICKGNVRNV